MGDEIHQVGVSRGPALRGRGPRRNPAIFDAHGGTRHDLDGRTCSPQLADRYLQVRSLTEQLAARLSPEDQMIQSMPDASPTKWHRAHTSWFFGTFLLDGRAQYRCFDSVYRYLFNSYYEAVGERHPRADRALPSGGRRMMAFLGSTIGNLDPTQRGRFLRDLDSSLWSSDWLLLGTDLVKDPDELVAAYDDGAGVTAAFNRNLLRVLNAEFAAAFDPAAFDHVADGTTITCGSRCDLDRP